MIFVYDYLSIVLLLLNAELPHVGSILVDVDVDGTMISGINAK